MSETKTISAICLTFGRVPQVENAIRNFLNQDYPHKELIVYNTFSEQHLFGEFPNVKIFNEPRPASLGEARNAAIERASGDVLAVYDDDDIYCSDHLSTIARHFTDGIEWVWLDSMFFTERGRIQKVVTASPNTFAFTKRIWKEIGGYESINTGEDRAAMNKLTAFKGVRVPTSPDQITFLYGWNTGTPHISGHGFDTPGARTGYDKVMEYVDLQAKAMLIPTGDVELKPTLRHDGDALKDEWLKQNHWMMDANANEVCIVLLGRMGDCCNALPIAKHIADRFGKPFWMVSREFADLFDGVSYVTPWITDLPPVKINEAVALARKRFKNVLVCQAYGENWQADKLSASYNRESWRLAGFANKFDDHSWKPVFDRRDGGRETVLLGRAYRSIYDETTTPMLLVNVTRAMSSPYPPGAALLAEIIAKFSARFHIVNIAELKLERVYDVLGLMERCVALVACDTVHLHLAAAVDCPTIAIVNAIPWLGTELRAMDNFIRFTYTDSVETIIAGMEKELAT